MNINLEYEGKHYNFDIKKDAKIDYLKEISSKLFKSDKTLLELICDNNKIDWENENIYIQDLIPKGKNSALLTVQMNDDIKNDNTQNQKNKKTQEIKDNKIELDRKKNIDKKKINYNLNIKIKNNNNDIDLSQIFENKIFIASYIKKSNELFAMMKEFNDTVKKTDNFLNKKMQNFNIACDNNIFYFELSLFEKRLIDFQKRQINYYKELIQILNKSSEENNESNLDIFYNKILLNNNENLEINKELKNKSKLFPNIGKKENKSIKKLKLSYNSDSLNNILPILKSDNNKHIDSLLNDLEKNKINDKEIFRTIDKRPKTKKDINFIETRANKIINKMNLKTYRKNNENMAEDKNIKYQVEDMSNKVKSNKNIFKNDKNNFI